jgi:hypothetical protein
LYAWWLLFYRVPVEQLRVAFHLPGIFRSDNDDKNFVGLREEVNYFLCLTSALFRLTLVHNTAPIEAANVVVLFANCSPEKALAPVA